MTSSASASVPQAFPEGHFYSPLVDLSEIAERQETIWSHRTTVPGVDFNHASHIALLDGAFARHMPAYQYPDVLEDSPDLTSFYSRNTQLSWLDARALFVLLSDWKPRRIVEVGSGYSTLLMADLKRKGVLADTCIECIEPFPRAFLRSDSLAIDRLQESKVQALPMAFFRELQEGDVLFVDSSHISKTGSDVNFLYLEVFPQLRSGVRVHVHDIFLPLEYPREWVHEGRNWNEQYLLQALISNVARYRILFGSTYARLCFPERLRELVDDPEVVAYGGGSLWFEVR